MKNLTTKKWAGVNIELANHIWRGMSHQSLIDLYTQRFVLPNKPALQHAAGETIVSRTHCLGLSEPEITMLLAAYDDTKGIFQTDLMRFIAPHQIAIGIKHHQACPNKNIEFSTNNVTNMLELVKFQATHLTIAVGVEHSSPNGHLIPGVITVNNPQNYPKPDPGEIGLFGPRDYPITWVKPEFPGSMPLKMVNAYLHNIRTWLVILNTVSTFPEHSYNGGDPLGAVTPDAIREFASLALRAIAGDAAAQEELNRAEHLVYCAELAYLALNIGTQFPLNKATIKQLGADPETIQHELVTKAFLRKNLNGKINLVKLTLAPHELRPIHDEPCAAITPVAPCQKEPFGKKRFAIQPQTVDSIVENFFARQFDRTKLIARFGEQTAAKIQALVLRSLVPTLLLVLEVNGLRNRNCELLEYTLHKLQFKFAQVYGDTNNTPETATQALYQAVQPERDVLRGLTGPRGNGVGAFCMPANFLLKAADRMRQQESKGYLAFSVLAFGLHESLLVPIGKLHEPHTRKKRPTSARNIASAGW